MSLAFRWLGAAGIELQAGRQRLAIDPFFTRPSLLGLVKPVLPDSALLREKLPECNTVLVTHSHWDHVMDVPVLLRQTGAVAFGSANTCQLLRLHGIPETQVNEVHVGDRLSLGAFKVEVIAGQHSAIPFDWIFNGAIRQDLQPPCRLQDYRMDVCLGYCITVMGMRLLVCAAEPQPADVLFMVAQETKNYYLCLFNGTRPDIFIPVHWDNFLRSSARPLRRFNRPGRMPLWQLAKLARDTLSDVKVIIPEIFKVYTLGSEPSVIF